MNTTGKIFLTIFLLIFALEAKSQVKILNLYESISLAKKNNSELTLARLEKLKADAKISEVYADNLIPTINLNSRYTRNFKKQIFQIAGQTFEFGSDNNFSHTLDVSEPIPVLGTPVFSAVRIAEYYSRLQDERIKHTETKIKADVTKAYLNVLLLKEVIQVNGNSLVNSEENLRVVEARYKAGVNTEFDFLRAKVKVETIKPQLQQSKNNLEISKKALKNAIGLKGNEEVDVMGSLIYDSLEVWGTMDYMLNKIAENNVAIRQLKIGRSINEELYDIDGSGFLPKLYLFGQYGLSTQENDGRGFFKYRYTNSLAAGVGLTWNLNFLRHRYKEDQSFIEIKKNDEQISDVKQKLKLQGESIILRMEDAKNRIKSSRETVELSERGLELANISFKSGVINQIDVLDAEFSVSQTKLGYLQAVYDYLVAKTELEQLLEK